MSIDGDTYSREYLIQGVLILKLTGKTKGFLKNSKDFERTTQKRRICLMY